MVLMQHTLINTSEFVEAAETTQQSRALADFAKDLGQFPASTWQTHNNYRNKQCETIYQLYGHMKVFVLFFVIFNVCFFF